MQIVTLGDPRLHQVSQPVVDIDRNLRDFIGQMFQAMYAGRGIGLAAVQVGRLVRLFITHPPNDEPRVFVNPQILETSLEVWKYEEGCLSIPGLNADVVRHVAVKVQAWSENGRPFTLEAEGLVGRVIQHEYDHLDGVLFIDRINSRKREKLLKDYQPQQQRA